MKKKKVAFDQKQKEALNRFEYQLKRLYTNDAKNAGINRLEIKKVSWLSRFLVLEVTLLCLLVVTIGAFFIWQRQATGANPSLEARFEMPREISSGEIATFVLYYHNIERFSLYDVDVNIHYPENFEFISAEPVPANTFNDLWHVGDLVKGERGIIKVRGKILGEVGSAVLMKANFNYQPQNFSSVFNDSFESPTAQISSSVAGVVVEGPIQAVPDQSVTYTVKYSNMTSDVLNGVRVRFEYPKNFLVVSTTPSVSHTDAIKNGNAMPESYAALWEVESLPVKGAGEITVQGHFIASENESEKILARVGQIGTDGQISYFQEKIVQVGLVGQSLRVEVLAGGSREDKSVNFGDTLNYTIRYKNLGSSTLHDLSIQALFESDVINWDTLIDRSNGLREDGKITWTSEQVPSLAILRPLDEGSIEFSVRLKEMKDINVKNDILETLVRAHTEIKKIDDLETTLALESNNHKASINTKVEMKVEGRYFDDDNLAVGQGPLPPVAGKTTTFRVYWKLANNLHKVSDVIVKTKLSPDAEWEDKFLVTTGSLVFNPVDKTIIWKMNGINPNQTFDEINAWFDVSVTPTENQVGKLLLLTAETSLSAKDEVTKSGVTQLASPITSNLEDDPIGGGQGLVEKAKD